MNSKNKIKIGILKCLTDQQHFLLFSKQLTFWIFYNVVINKCLNIWDFEREKLFIHSISLAVIFPSLFILGNFSHFFIWKSFHASSHFLTIVINKYLNEGIFYAVCMLGSFNKWWEALNFKDIFYWCDKEIWKSKNLNKFFMT